MIVAPIASVVDIVAELATAAALAGGAVQAFHELRAKWRARAAAREELESISTTAAVDGELIKQVLGNLSDSDRRQVLKALTQRNKGAKRRYLRDIIPPEANMPKPENALTELAS